MCGIAGYWGTGDKTILARMGSSLTHRGPDAGGEVHVGPVGLAHRRLTIVDLSPTGSQPMHSRDGSLTLVFNGEIYNHKELRETYLHDCIFAGTSDTEVILHLYEKLGEACFENLSGMFAIALYDSVKNKLILARDRMGKKPLYYTQVGDTLIFGSELKALREHPLCPHTLNRTAVAQYLVYEYIPAPATMYESVYKVPQGTHLTYNGTTLSSNPFATIDPKQNTYTKSFVDAKEELFQLLSTAVADRMVADVPVGVFLSGGLDSSTIAYMAQQMSENQVKTFSIGFADASFDESAYAREVAQMLGTQHYEKNVGPQELLKVVTRIPQILDEPMADSSIIPTTILSEFAKEEVKVTLGGDGADELFWGYDTFFAHRVGNAYARIPSVLRTGIRTLVNALPVSHEYMSLDFKAKKFLSGFDTTPSRRNTYWLSAFTPPELSALLTYEVDEATLLTSTDAYYTHDANFWDSLEREYVSGYLAEDILVKTDRAGMASGLEVRAPFLDTVVVDFALGLNIRYKYHGKKGKYILKEMIRGKLPAHIIDRSKKGFNIPIGKWISNELRPLFTQMLLEGKLAKSGLFKPEGLAILLKNHLEGRVDNRKKLWSLLVLALWMEEWYGN